MANNPVMMKILQQSEQGSATGSDVTTNTVEPEPLQLKCASCQADSSVQFQASELQLDSNPDAQDVQLAAKGEKSSSPSIQQVAATGFSGSSTSLPHLNQIQQSFGVDLSGVQAYIGGSAAAACQQMGAAAYASGNQIAFKEQPSLELAAHEAAHVVQQRSGKVQLAGGVGQVGDKYENHADAVAAKVGAGESAAQLLADFSAGQKTNQNGEKLSQKQSSTDTHSTESHLGQTRAEHPNEAQRLFDLGILQDAQGNYQEALKFFEETLKLAPNDSITWYNRGVVLSKLNRLQDALDAYQTALAINNNWGEAQPSFAWLNRGTILRHLGRFNEAIQSYQQALAQDPGNEVIQNNLRNLEAYLSANPSLSNQSQQTPEPEQGNNLLQTLLGGLQGAFNENQTGDEAIADFLIGLIPIIGQLVDGRDFAAYVYRIVFKRQFNDVGNWIGLALTLVGLVPVVGDIAKFLGKTVVRGGNLEDVIKLIRSINPGFIDDIAQLKDLLKQNWGKGVQAALDRWNTALGQLLNWANGIPDLLFSQQKRQLIEAILEVKSQSDKMLSRAFDEIRQKINDALDEIGRRINPNGNLATANGAPIPGRADNSPPPRNEPMRIEGGNAGGGVPRLPDPPLGMSETLLNRRATLQDPRAVQAFDDMFLQIGSNSNRMEQAIQGMQGNLEERMLDRWRRANPIPYGAAVGQVPAVLARGEALRNQIQAFSDANPQIRGVNEWLRRLKGETTNLNKMQRGDVEATPQRVEGAENNINGVAEEFRIAQTETGVTGVNQKFSFLENLSNRRTIDADIVAANGNLWIDIKRVRPFGLQSTDWVGDPSGEFPGVRDQAQRMLRAAQENPNNGVVPAVAFEFPLGVSREVAEALQNMGVGVRGTIVDVP